MPDGSTGASPAMRPASVSAGNGTKCITMPVANHIANNRQNATPNQRCSTVRGRNMELALSPLERGGHFIGAGRVEQDLIRVERIAPDGVSLVRQVAHAE